MAVKSIVRASVGSLYNFGWRTRFPVFLQHIVKDIWKTKVEKQVGVQFAEYLGGAILYSDPSVVSMSMDMLLQEEGDIVGKWKLAKPAGNEKQFLKQYDATPNLVASVVGAEMLSAAPQFVLTLARNPSPPVGMDPKAQKWELVFGQGLLDSATLVLELTRLGNPRLLYRTVGLDGETLTERVIATHEVPESDRQGFAFDFYQRWEVANINGRLYLRCNHLSEPWVVEGVGMVPEGAWKFNAFGGVFSFNLTPVTFVTSGYFETKRVEHYFLVPDNAMEFRTFGSTPTGCGVQAQVIESGYALGETWKRYRVTLTGDGGTTPFLHSVEAGAESVFEYPTTQTWVPLNPFITSMSETLSEDMATRKSTLRVSLYKRNGNGETFADVFGSLLGEHLVTIAAGYTLEDGVTEIVEDRMVGVLQAQDFASTPKSKSLTFTCYDRWTKLAEKRLFKAPALTGLRLDLAIAKVARCGGVAPADMVLEAIDVYVSQPVDYTGGEGLPWVPADGTAPTEVVKQLCALGAVAEYWEDGKLHVYAQDDTTLRCTFSTVVGTDPLYALSSLTYTQDLAGKVNHIVVVGADGKDGAPLAGRWHYDAIFTEGSPCFKGDLATEFITNGNLVDLDAVNRECVEAYNKRDGGWPILKVSSRRGWVACHLWPRYRVAVEDYDWSPILGEVLCRVKDMQVSYGRGAPKLDSMTLGVIGDE